MGRTVLGSGARVFRNQLRDLNILIMGVVAGFGIGVCGLFAALILTRGGFPILAFGFIAFGVLISVLVPIISPLRDVPNYLLLQEGALWAVYGPPAKGRRLHLPWKSITRLHLGPEYVQVVSPSPEAPGRSLTFNLRPDSYPELTEARDSALKARDT